MDDPVDDNMKSLVEQRQRQDQSPATVTAQHLPNQSPNHNNNIMATNKVILWRRRSLRFVSQLWLLLLLWFMMMYVHVTTVSAFSSMAQQKPPPPLRIRTTFPRGTTTQQQQQQQQQQHWYKLPQQQLQQHHPKPQHRCNAVAKSDSNGDATDSHVNNHMGTPPIFQQTDPIIRNAAKILQRTSWISWWCQVILTVISSVILLFAKSNSSITNNGGSNFILSTLGLLCSTISIVWTWGNGTRLSRRFLIRPISRQQVQMMIRRAIQVGITLNCMGLLCHLLAAQQIIGLLAVKVLTNRSGGGGGLLLAAALDGSSNTLQPLDILIVQANTNALLSQYLSLVLLLSLMVRILPTLPEPVIVTTTTTTDF
jgi:Protein of unknown function (DUF3611)